MRERIWKWIFAAIILLTCIGSVFGKCNLFTDSTAIPKWIFSMLGISILGVAVSYRLWISRQEDNQWITIMESYSIIAIISVCTAESIYVLFQVMSDSSNIHKGSFENPAGLASCICFAAPYTCVLKDRCNSNWLFIVGMTLFLLALLSSQSRTGMVAFSVAFLFLLRKGLSQRFFRLKRCYRYIAAASTILLAMMFSILLYNINRDSADGRMLIWRVGANMAIDKPILGHGIGSVSKKYMDYQATFLNNAKNDGWNNLADNTKHLFNEYLEVLVQYGALGILFLFACLYLIGISYKRCSDEISKYALASILAIIVFSFFSYPFSYPFTWIIIVFDILVIMADAHGDCLAYLIKTHRKVISVALLVVSLLTTYHYISKLRHEVAWGKVANNHSVNGVVRLEEYKELRKCFNANPYFLYNYAMEAYCYGENKLCAQIAERCRRYWADYDLELLIGVNYLDLQEYDLAQQYLVKSQNMCPNRFEPLYYRVLAYKEQDRMDMAKELAIAILNKQVKIPSREIEEIKNEMRGFLHQNDAKWLTTIN